MSSALDKFCGSQFWDWSTFNSSVPDFTECFQKTVLVWIPCSFLWLVAPFYFYCLKANNKGYINVSLLHRAKVVASLLLIILPLIDLFTAIANYASGMGVWPVDVVTPLILALSLMLALVLIHLGRIHGATSSGVMFIFWLVMLVCCSIPFRSKIIFAQSQSDLDILSCVTFYIYYALVILEMVLAAIPDSLPYYSKISTDPNPCPEQTASFLSRITFWWFTRLIVEGYKHSLELKDIWSLNPSDLSKAVSSSFQREWKKEENRSSHSESNTIHKLPVNIEQSYSNGNKYYVEMQRKTEGYSSKGSDIIISPEASLLKALMRTFGRLLLMAGLLKLVNDILLFVNPQLLSLMITFVSNDDAYMWQGYLYACLLLLFSLLQSIIIHQYFHLCFLMGMRLRTAITGAIYRKSVRLTSSARRASTAGEIVNLMSVDAQRLMELMTYLHMVWSAPLQIAVALYFLWRILGPSVLAGLAVMVLLIPVNLLVANFNHKLQAKQMTQKDSRIKMISEILNGIKVLKLYAWELFFQEKVSHIRNKELHLIRSSAFLNAFTLFLLNVAPTMVSLATFAVFVLIDEKNILDAETAFVSLALFNILRFPLNALPQLISNLVQANVSRKRLEKFLKHNEINPKNISRDTNLGKNAIVLDNATLSWDPQESPILHNVSLQVGEGSLVAVVGQVGSGKSSLLSALLGELQVLNGHISVKDQPVAYVPQQAWIQNATLRDNVLFGGRMDATAYSRVIQACALPPDLQVLPAGDQTEIGVKGINLSGGQKQRVSLARAVYSNASIYLLDDPLSAVDAHVGRHIFDNVLGHNGLLKRKTRVLVTNAVKYLPQVDQIVMLVDGRVSAVGSYHQLLAQHQAFADFLQLHRADEEEEETTDQEDPSEDRSRKENGVGESTLKGIQADNTSRSAQDSTMKKSGELKDNNTSKVVENGKPVENGIKPVRDGKAEQILIKQERTETGRVKRSVFLIYVRSFGVALSLLVMLMFLLLNGAAVATNLWLARWSEEPAINGTQSDKTNLYLAVYGVLGFSQGVYTLVRAFATAVGGMLASGRLHHAMLANTLLCSMAFYDVTPLGRILNRFSKDVDTVDRTIPAMLTYFIGNLLRVVFALGVIAASTPFIVIVFVFLIVIYLIIQQFYIATSRQLKRLESVSRSPIYSHFQESLAGVNTIRAYQAQARFFHENERKVDQNHVTYYPNICSNRWLGLRLEFIGSCVVFFSALFSVISRDSVSPGIAGLSISYAMQITTILTCLVRRGCDLETNIVAVERIKEYSEQPTEAPLFIKDRKPPDEWPENGVVTFKNYSVRYRENLDLVLKGINCHIKSGEKIGIVGRTGAGKSSMALALFRMIEAAGGTIEIDGKDISQLGLFDLRSKLTIIPQDPVVFSGTIRMNLDPFERFSDAELWHALEMAHLHGFVSSLSGRLMFECSEGGENLSVGQRQLLCLGRALLKCTRLLVLDEATAAVDPETDRLVQATVRAHFPQCTVLTIAHRLHTVMDSTRIMVLDRGGIAEFGTPTELLSQGGVFHSMAREEGLPEALKTD